MRAFKFTLLIILTAFSSLGWALNPLEFEVPSEDQALKVIQDQANLKEMPRRFRLLVWNINKGSNSTFSKEWQKLSQRHLSLVQEHLHNLPMHQEMKVPKREVLMGVSFYTKADQNEPTGVATLSQAQSLHSRVIHSQATEPLVFTPKASLISSYALENGQELLVANVHAINFVSTWAFGLQMKELAETIARHKGPVIFAGDFNTWSGPRTSVLTGLVEQVGLKAVDFAKDLRKTFLGYPLDHIFIRGLNVLQGTTLKTDASDHNPMLLELSY